MLKRTPPPNALPPAEVRILDLHAEPWPDGQRIKVFITLTPFQEFPNLEVGLFTQNGDEIRHTSIIENIDERLVFTMHLPQAEQEKQNFVLKASLGYPDLPDVDRSEADVSL